MCGKKRQQVRICKSIINYLLLFVLFSCGESENDTKKIEGHVILGEAQGTTYQIILAEEKINFTKAQIDSVLKAVDMSLSTYVDSSVISMLNASENTISLSDPSGFFSQCYHKSQEVYHATNGIFDPSVYPLVAGWGFMKDPGSPLSGQEVDSILEFVSFKSGKIHSVSFNGDSITLVKQDPRFKLDFNAIAQGLSVDLVADFIRGKGHKNFYIEIGGEMVVEGMNRSGENWKIGIDAPIEQEEDGVRKLENVIQLTDKAIATSGNYRKFYEVDGKKYAHTLDPKSGYPVQHSLLSATVIAKDCATADAYATAFMVMGVEKTKQFLKDNPQLKLDVYLLFDQEGSIARFSTKGMSRYFQE
jgi:thiamine biosynthesis lipoprotein